MVSEDPGTHPATAAIIYGLVAFFFAPVPAVFVLVTVERHPGYLAGLGVIAFQIVACVVAVIWGARSHRGGSEW